MIIAFPPIYLTSLADPEEGTTEVVAFQNATIYGISISSDSRHRNGLWIDQLSVGLVFHLNNPIPAYAAEVLPHIPVRMGDNIKIYLRSELSDPMLVGGFLFASGSD